MIAVFVLKSLSKEMSDLSDKLDWVFIVIMPNYCFSSALQSLYNNYNSLKLCTIMVDEGYCASLPKGVENYCCIGEYCSLQAHNYYGYNDSLDAHHGSFYKLTHHCSMFVRCTSL